MNLEVNIPEPINHKLELAQAKYNFAPSELITQLLTNYLQDLEDGEEALKILAENNAKFSLDDIISENGLAG
jgi:hypothetical protein